MYFWWDGWSFVYERRGWMNGRIYGNSKVVELSRFDMVPLRGIGVDRYQINARYGRIFNVLDFSFFTYITFNPAVFQV